ncbi:uncharacterized protein LOC143238952 isoform X2 [Tachypleus tridentatus]
MESRLTKEEALYFISKILEIPEAKRKLVTDRSAFLDHVIQTIHQVIPFQNISLLSLEPDHRHIPTWAEIKEAMMAKQGGTCYILNVFVKYLLQALGFDVYHTASAFGFPNNHISTIVRNLSSRGTKHLVDFSAFPTFKAIPLDFKEESPVYSMSFLKFKFVRQGNLIIRVHKTLDIPIPKNRRNKDGWSDYFIFDLEPRDLSYFEEDMTKVYTVAGVNSPILENLYFINFPGLQLCGIKNKFELSEGADQKTQYKQLSSKFEVVQSIINKYPQFREDQIISAIDRINLFTIYK